MKKHLISLLLILVGITSIAQQTYTISVKIEGLKDSLAFLGTYTGKNLFVYDTAVVKSDGSFMFTNTDMPHGVYSIIPTIKPFSNFAPLIPLYPKSGGNRERRSPASRRASPCGSRTPSRSPR